MHAYRQHEEQSTFVKLYFYIAGYKQIGYYQLTSSLTSENELTNQNMRENQKYASPVVQSSE